jgi:hypothetical protein
MKKDRIVALCICVLLLGNYHVQQIAGIWQIAMPSPPQIIWAFTTGKPFGIAACSWPLRDNPQSPGRFGLVTAAMHAGWPQLAFVYDQVLLLKTKLSDLPSHSAGSRVNTPIP